MFTLSRKQITACLEVKPSLIFHFLFFFTLAKKLTVYGYAFLYLWIPVIFSSDFVVNATVFFGLIFNDTPTYPMSPSGPIINQHGINTLGVFYK
jgi:hypothetical protein